MRGEKIHDVCLVARTSDANCPTVIDIMLREVNNALLQDILTSGKKALYLK